MLIAVLILIYVLSGIGCAYEENILNSIRINRPQNVNEKVEPYFNKEHLSMGEFLAWAGKEVQHDQEYHGWRIYKIRVEIARDLVGKYEIKIIWVYYD